MTGGTIMAVVTCSLSGMFVRPLLDREGLEIFIRLPHRIALRRNVAYLM
jgi:hypothetical protein